MSAILVSLQEEKNTRYVTLTHTYTVYVRVCVSSSPAVKIKDNPLNKWQKINDKNKAEKAENNQLRRESDTETDQNVF